MKARITRIGLVWRTVRHLTAQQLVYQVLNRLRGRGRLHLPPSFPAAFFLVTPKADKPVSWVADRFTFLNRPVYMPIVDWNCARYGKLWTYHLNYFDFLNQADGNTPALRPDEGVRLIRQFMQSPTLIDGLEPYPTSLRIMNWIRFLSRHQIQDAVVNQHLYAQTGLLRRRLEYHLAGNHLLENGFALTLAALYFRHPAWFRCARSLLQTQLSDQILADGGHQEGSPMYHQILLDRLLDILLALRHDSWHKDSAHVAFLETCARRMLVWLEVVTFRNGDIPMVNDADWGIAPSTAQLQTKAALVLKPEPTMTLTELNGYRKVTSPRYELLADVGAIGPDHQPGHAHADTFSFVLYVDSCPVIVDSGTSTYEIGPRRMWERGTAAHNTVSVMERDSSELWAGFRVGCRARVQLLSDTPVMLFARHDGYRHLGIHHERSWSFEPTRIRLTDRLVGTKATRQILTGVARLHLHPNALVRMVAPNRVSGTADIMFESGSVPAVSLTTYQLADGFNRYRPAICIEITFTDYLETTLLLT
jgi:Heparinase II/III-like protein/Heparinase II/III N-terminus